MNQMGKSFGTWHWAAAILVALTAMGSQAHGQGPAQTPQAGAPAAPKREELPLQDSVTQYGITWTFEKPARVGQFITGDFYVVGPVTVASVAPRPENNKNGSMLNPATGNQQGYGECKSGYAQTLVYNPKLSAAYPVAMKGGDSLVSTVSFADKDKRPRIYKYGTNASVTRSAAVLTCLEAPVPADTFRPFYCGHQGRQYRYSELRLERLPSLKPPAEKAPPVPAPATDEANRVKQLEDLFPELADYERLFERPWIDHVYHWGSREIHPAGNMPDYGQAVAQAVSEASLLLLCDYPLEKRKKLLVGFVQYGIDLYGAVERGCKGWPQAGGFGAGRKWPILFAGLLFADEKMQKVQAEFGEDMGTMLDKCWTGGNAVFTGHSGRDGMGDPERGEYEHLHPSRWPGTESEAYRRCCNSHSWAGFALAARLMHAETVWNHDAFFAYVDRWMGEDDEEAMDHLDHAYRARGWHWDMRGIWARQKRSWEPFVTEMWAKYRFAPGMAPSAYKPVETVRAGNVAIDARGGFVVDGKPFLPILLVDGEPNQIELAKAVGVNTFLGCGWKHSSSAIDRSYKEFLDKLAEAGLYGVFGADARLAGQKNLLGYLQYDRPDRVTVVKDADVILDDADRGERPSPPSRVVDGDTAPGRGATLGPLEGMTLTIKVKKPVTAAALAIWLDDKGSATLPKDVVFLADGKEVLKATLEKKDGQQRFDLKEPATFTALTFKVDSAYPATQKWGRIDEIQALDKDGKPIALYEERRIPAIVPELIGDVYKWCKGRDASRPVFLDLTSFAPRPPAGWEPEAKRKLYGEYVKSCDAAGIETAGAAGPSEVAAAVAELRALAGAGRAVFVCIDLGAKGLTPQEVRAQAWSALIGGATAVGYRLPVSDPKQKEPALPDAMRDELKRLNGQIARLSAALLAEPVKAMVELGLPMLSPCRIKATELDGTVYVFAFAYGTAVDKSGLYTAGGNTLQETIKVAGLKAGTKIEVVGEDRQITADDGQFTDNFIPLTEHVYKIKM